MGVEAGVLDRSLVRLGPAVSEVDRREGFAPDRSRQRQEALGELFPPPGR